MAKTRTINKKTKTTVPFSHRLVLSQWFLALFGCQSFGELDYMDRRGSGINRILKDFSDCPVKPKFFSEASWFRVSMPNRNDVFRKKTSISGEDNVPLEEQRFIQKIDCLTDIRGKTRERILVLRRKYEIEMGFTRLNIMREFNITERQASRMLAIFLKHDLIEKVKTGEYVFKRMEK